MHPTASRQPEQGSVADVWAARAPELARWAQETIIVRADAYGGHRADGSRTTCHTPPTLGRLARHFAARDRADVIGFHVSSCDETCRTTWVDIDAHEGDGSDPATNLRFAGHVRDGARKMGLAVRLFDSNGKGGFHVLILHRMPIALAFSWRLGKYVVRDHAAFGFTSPPETFPKSPRLTGKRFGGWVRLPGRHHKRDHWTRVWSPKTNRWLEGDDAIRSLLKLTGHQVDLAAVIPAEFEPATGRSHAIPVNHERRLQGRDHERNLRLARAALPRLGEAYRDDYDQWLRVGMALRQLGPDGLELWESWSMASPRYEAGATAAKWASFAAGPACGGVTLGTLFAFAQQEGWDARDEEWVGEVDERGVRRRTSRAGRKGTIIIPTGPTPSLTDGGQRQ
jgi:hypothetical protein